MTRLSNVRKYHEICLFLFKSSKELTSVIRSGKDQNSGYPKWLTMCESMPNHGCDFKPLTIHMTKLRNFTKGEKRDFLAFRFSLHLMLELSNLILCLIISQKLHIKLHK